MCLLPFTANRWLKFSLDVDGAVFVGGIFGTFLRFTVLVKVGVSASVVTPDISASSSSASSKDGINLLFTRQFILFQVGSGFEVASFLKSSAFLDGHCSMFPCTHWWGTVTSTGLPASIVSTTAKWFIAKNRKQNKCCKILIVDEIVMFTCSVYVHFGCSPLGPSSKNMERVVVSYDKWCGFFLSSCLI